MNINAFVGDTNSIIIPDGIAPINGPKNGIIFVTPIITDINKVYGILNIVNTTLIVYDKERIIYLIIQN